MRQRQRIKQLFWMAVTFIFFMSASILLMPGAVHKEVQNRLPVFLTGLVFWISALSGYVFLALANKERKRLRKHDDRNKTKMKELPGILTFCTNIPAVISDMIMALSLCVFVISRFTSFRYEYITYIWLFLLIFSLHMHCLFNGKIYKFIYPNHIRSEISYEKCKK